MASTGGERQNEKEREGRGEEGGGGRGGGGGEGGSRQEREGPTGTEQQLVVAVKRSGEREEERKGHLQTLTMGMEKKGEDSLLTTEEGEGRVDRTYQM